MKRMVITAFFAAITFLGIQAFRIPLPAVVGTPFVHFGHIFVVLGVLLQGGKRGAVSGTLGLVIFDILNGFLQDVPQVFLETVIKCLLIGALFAALKKRAEGNMRKEYRDAMFCTVVYGCMNILIEFVMGIVKMMILGSGFCGGSSGISGVHPSHGDQCCISCDRGGAVVSSGGETVSPDVCIREINSSIARVLYLCLL